MGIKWAPNGRQLSNEVMSELRKIAVRAVIEKDYSPELVIDVIGLSRSCIYDWLNRYYAGGIEGLESQVAPGAPSLLSPPIEQWLREAVLESTPQDHGYDSVLWTRQILAELIKKYFGIKISGRTVSEYLRKMDLSYQKPSYRAEEQNPEKVEHFLEDTFPRIQRLAAKMGADIGFEDESGVHLSAHAGRTWGEKGKTPEVVATAKKGSCNVLSVITADGQMQYSLETSKINAVRYVEFLKQVLKGRTRPLILIVDKVSFHSAGVVKAFDRANRKRLRIYFLPSYSPELNPDEQVWNEIKNNKLGKQSIKNKSDLIKRLRSALQSLQRQADRVISFFHLPDTEYAAI